jgi:hypothetical protein
MLYAVYCILYTVLNVTCSMLQHVEDIYIDIDIDIDMYL